MSGPRLIGVGIVLLVGNAAFWLFTQKSINATAGAPPPGAEMNPLTQFILNNPIVSVGLVLGLCSVIVAVAILIDGARAQAAIDKAELATERAAYAKEKADDATAKAADAVKAAEAATKKAEQAETSLNGRTTIVTQREADALERQYYLTKREQEVENERIVNVGNLQRAVDSRDKSRNELTAATNAMARMELAVKNAGYRFVPASFEQLALKHNSEP